MRFVACYFFLLAVASHAQSPLPALLEALLRSDDPQFHLDVLKGMSDGLKGHRDHKMPAGWEALARKLKASASPQVRELARNLSVTFGSKEALQDLRATVSDKSADASSRRAALQTLIGAKDPGAVEALTALLDEPALRAPAIRGMAAYHDPAISAAIIRVYPRLDTLERKDALTTLTSRPPFAKALLAAVADMKIPPQNLTADILRLLRNLKDPSVEKSLTRQFGVARESTEDKAREIARYRGMVESGAPGDPQRGKEVFARNCQQCHTLFGSGGKVGPDLTGSDRGNIYYVLQNIIDPNAVMPNMYRASTLETKDDRVITGIVTKQDLGSVTIATATETLTISRTDVQFLQESELSMMPEGLIQTMTDADVRDLVAYLKGPGKNETR